MSDFLGKKLSIIVPYRNREEHLQIFINEMSQFIKNIDFNIVIVEQNDEKPFNRAKLLNIGFDHKRETSDYFCFHDVDMIPIESDYSYPDKPYHMVTYVSQFGGIAYPDYYGGVNIFNKEDFIKINGYSNDFWGWGGEDDDFLKRIKEYGYDLYRRKGTYRSLSHKFNGPNHANYEGNIIKLGSTYDYQTDGLSNLKYELVSVEKINEITELLKVKI